MTDKMIISQFIGSSYKCKRCEENSGYPPYEGFFIYDLSDTYWYIARISINNNNIFSIFLYDMRDFNERSTYKFDIGNPDFTPEVVQNILDEHVIRLNDMAIKDVQADDILDTLFGE